MGFGAAIARRMGLEGAAVIVNYPGNKSEADKVVSDIVASGGRAISLCEDITRRYEVQTMLSEAVEALGRWTFLSTMPVHTNLFH
jgi:3-oxoacyl-[acyl-carrier protein] reductase